MKQLLKYETIEVRNVQLEVQKVLENLKIAKSFWKQLVSKSWKQQSINAN